MGHVCMCVCFQTIDKLGFGAELLFSIQTDKRQRHSGAVCFMSCEQSAMPQLGPRVRQAFSRQYPFSLYRGHHAVMHRQDKHTWAAFNETTPHTQTRDRDRCGGICEFSTLYERSDNCLPFAWLKGTIMLILAQWGKVKATCLAKTKHEIQSKSPLLSFSKRSLHRLSF